MPRDWESRVALAMLPAGAVMTLVSVVATAAVALLALDTLVRRPAEAVRLIAWCIAAGLVGLRNTVLSIETMSAFEWRPMAQVLALSALVAIAYPGWWAAT